MGHILKVGFKTKLKGLITSSFCLLFKKLDFHNILNHDFSTTKMRRKESKAFLKSNNNVIKFLEIYMTIK